MYSHQFLDLIYCFGGWGVLHFFFFSFFKNLLFGRKTNLFSPQSPDLSHILGLSFNWDSFFSSILAVRNAFTAIVLGL